MERFQPTETGRRLGSIDFTRGIALLGILLINVAGMALPDPAYFDPSLVGGSTGPDLDVFIFNSIFVEGTMRGLFAMLFGAGMILFFENRKNPELPELTLIWYRRLIFLILFGMIHAWFLLWPGDILFSYGMTGLLLFPFLKLKPRYLFLFSVIIVLAGILLNYQDARQAKKQQAGYFAAAALIEEGKEVPYETLMHYYSWMEKYAVMKPSPWILKERIKKTGSGYRQAFSELKLSARFFESEYHYRHNYIDILSMMLLGMALFRLGILQGDKARSFYLLLAAGGYLIGIPVNAWETWEYTESSFDLIRYYELLVTYDIGRISVMTGHLGMILLVFKSGIPVFLKNSIVAVGKMAFSNYILQTLILITIFIGFSQYGKWQRHELYYLVPGIWIFQLIFSPLWLKYFSHGPLEWIWRMLSYGQCYPLLKSGARASSD